MKLTEDTLKQHIKQVLAEQSRYPMKRSKDPQAQKKQRFEINAACYGWLREPVKPGDLGKPNRVWGDCIEKSLITKEEWRQARRLNWNGDLAGAQRILDGGAGKTEKDPAVACYENCMLGKAASAELCRNLCSDFKPEAQVKPEAPHTHLPPAARRPPEESSRFPRDPIDTTIAQTLAPRHAPEESSRFRRDPIDTTRKRTPWDLLYDLAKDDAKIIAQIARWQEENKKIGNLGLPRGPRRDRYGRRPITGRANSDPGYQFVRDMLQAAGYKVSDEEWDPSKWKHHSTTTLPTFDPETGRSVPIKESVAYSSFPEQQKLHEGWKDYLEPK